MISSQTADCLEGQTESPHELEFTEFLRQVPQHAPRPREQTLFSLGGRGYYENPASDILAFFLDPNVGHGFGSLFLDCFLQCLEKPIPVPDMALISVQREVPTDKGKIDLLLRAGNWILIIENKIWHHQGGNPFADYAAHAKKITANPEPLLAILSPSGHSSQAGWEGVSYKKYCNLLDRALTDAAPQAGDTKWLIFARELILHFTTELYTQEMTQEEIDFVELNLPNIEKAKALERQYRDFLMGEIGKILNEADPAAKVRVKDSGWGFTCKAEGWGSSAVTWWKNPSGRIRLSIYLRGNHWDLEAAREKLQDGLGLVPSQQTGITVWSTPPEGHANREEAHEMLRVVGPLVGSILRTVPATAST